MLIVPAYRVSSERQDAYMTRRQFNLRALKQIRELEQSRARERLAEFADPITSQIPASIDEDSLDSLQTRRDIKAISGPLSDRLRGLDSQRQSDPLDGSKPTTVVLTDLDGNMVASLACDESAGIIILGRGQNATVKVSDPYVHRVHAHIRWDANTHAHVIMHGGGENATYVNKRKIRAPHTLKNGHRIRIGRTELIYRVD